MRFARLGPVGQEIPVLETEDGFLDLRSVTTDINGSFFASSGPSRVQAALDSGDLLELAGSGLRVGSPVARPGAAIGIGMNYAAHAAESGVQPPTHPVVFFKHPNSIAGPNDSISIPAESTKLDWEVELAMVIGRSAYRLKNDEDALASVAGYTVSNDVSERTWQVEISGGQWSKGKCGPGFLPLGPTLVTPDEVDVENLRLTSSVNGEERQDSSTGDMIFKVARIVTDLSQYMRLDPGDVIFTGTPEGVALSGRFPFLTPGDIVEIAIEGLGHQRHSIVALEEA